VSGTRTNPEGGISAEESEHLIRASGPHWIGQDASLNALSGIATVVRVAKGVTRLVAQDGSAALHANESSAGDDIAHRLDPIVIEVDDAGISGLVTLPANLAGERVPFRLKESHDQEP
jgi:hypothetical protein